MNLIPGWPNQLRWSMIIQIGNMKAYAKLRLAIKESSMSDTQGSEIEGTVYKTVSLKRFECGSSTLFHEIERDPTNKFLLDLPK